MDGNLSKSSTEGIAGLILAILFTMYMMACDKLIMGPEIVETLGPNETIYYIYHSMEEGEYGAYFYVYSITGDSIMWTGTTEVFDKVGKKLLSYSENYPSHSFPPYLENTVLTAYVSVTY
tara:strand:- start:1259 stop:1618 length:360 start_codon:yes stop_codon:yes gene_type:complete